jgi:hypothetical protein
MNPQIMLKFVEVHGGISDFRTSKPSLYTNVFFFFDGISISHCSYGVSEIDCSTNLGMYGR